MSKRISMNSIRRLPRYYRFLIDIDEKGIDKISSNELAAIMHSTASQVRHDLTRFGVFGVKGFGYPVKELKDNIAAVLGLNKRHKAILFGAGNIGKAVATNLPFEEMGFELCGIFERDERLIGTTIHGIEVMSKKYFVPFCNENSVEVAILCLPQESVESVVCDAYSQGIKCFWNFNHYDITEHYPDAIVENVHIGDSLITLCYKITQQTQVSDNIFTE